MVVIHYTAMKSAEAARDWLCNPEAQVSAHYVIAEDGRIWQLVDEAARAWHAGAGQWGSCTDVNSRSIGIELSNLGTHPFAEPQMAALESLLKGILARWTIPPERVIGHSDMAPGRKIDPGPRFDWQRLARQGLAVWPDALHSLAHSATDSPLEAALAAIGYTCDVPLDTRLSAFRSRFNRAATGPATQADLAIAQSLAARFPVDRGQGSA
ncbi:N-acetylmuramoyl-L-alanine amidase [Pseudoprimorskyibacter insulae]|uniref:N-acetylmuramoyl-L-alanine amidase n=1 Tax=Pseudoprimorskyibacter insulae TaxID=1695997 RepID=A0A2R8AR94_9RHOB|nr:N-acetylmuramoyl-L-alanine amidase [Pseudoprimorskyibacter insulae]SPF78359.1 N-acetylmuramoyl-L-alanine amidase AmiD [Pseudoprimorskyibacter insulae]